MSVSTNTQTEQAEPEEAPLSAEQSLALTAAVKALDTNKKLSFAEVVALLGNPFEVESAPTPTEIHVPEITEDQRAALRKVALIYGVVQPTEPRLLSEQELSALMDERQTIDTILSLLEPRKSKSIRETIAFHFDRMVEQSAGFDPANPPEKDANGHYAVKQAAPAPGTGMEWQRIVQNNKPTLTSAAIEQLFLNGELTREEYLSVTSKPPVARVFDEEKARAAIKKNPALMFKLAQASVPGSKTTVIKTGKDEG